MKLSALLKDLEYEILQGETDREITGVAYDSRKVEPGFLFVALKGAVSDGHRFIPDVVSKGAAAVLLEDPADVDENVTVIRTDNTRRGLALVSAAWFGYPAKSLKTIGITGTKGKTTSTYMIRSILENAGHKTGLIGTIECITGKRHIKSENTTPESYLVQEYFREMADAGFDSVVMEVSSQAFKMDRVAGITFDYGIFTNIEPDHIGPNEHESFEEYLDCKKQLLKNCRVGIVNRDDERFEQIIEGAACALETYGFHSDSDFMAKDASLVSKPGYLGISYHAAGKIDLDVEIDIPGKFSIYNSLAAIAVCYHFGVEKDDICKALKMASVKGRVEMVKVSDEFTLMIDYAHNAMALESLLSTLREYNPHRLVCLFGCGGNRDRQRRFEMGEISGKLADLTVITSDNPRNEEPQAIIDDIKTGMEKTDGKYVEIIDRKDAIRYVIRNGEPGDIIILAGKGHEDYQIIKGKKYPMDERVLIQEILAEKPE
ncbi:MAG TPA: UDP-N-acetylmuramoyl-L-alanyl-D-glutamate--2,6-diaminopimelate ligase [Lachnospiraceae bacterium]|nr:UDP-N-acetylmuramoyl-L-alanyl-D-glutamate--2,6-diaminopimelate ligase [Lachnospiraceae bacterium]